MSNPFQLTFTLKQHTPIIHFQHDQDGATLRATEVKPKLDRFIVEKMGGKEQMDKSWFNNYERESLNYKISITGNVFCGFKLQQTHKDKMIDGQMITVFETENFPTFLANMGGKQNKEELKNFSLFEFVEVKVNTHNTGIINAIKTSLCDFFLSTNFGNRQTKGFGCFYPDEEKHGNEDWYVKPSSTYFFDVVFPNDDNFFIPFDAIGLFYRSIRQGINNKKKINQHDNRAIEKAKAAGIYHKGSDGNHYKEVFYFKSLMFLYAKEYFKAKWEKKKIKEEFFPISNITGSNGTTFRLPYRLDEQKDARPDSEALHFDSRNFFLFRDLLGFSTDESWKSYRDQIKKSQARKSSAGRWEKTPEKERTFERFGSPILFKPFLTTDSRGNQVYRIYILLNQEQLSSALEINKDFMIENERRREFHISYPNNFDLENYFSFFLNIANFNIYTHVESKFHSANEFNLLSDIFEQLRRQSHNINNPES